MTAKKTRTFISKSLFDEDRVAASWAVVEKRVLERKHTKSGAESAGAKSNGKARSIPKSEVGTYCTYPQDRRMGTQIEAHKPDRLKALFGQEPVFEQDTKA